MEKIKNDLARNKASLKSGYDPETSFKPIVNTTTEHYYGPIQKTSMVLSPFMLLLATVCTLRCEDMLHGTRANKLPASGGDEE